MYFKDTKNIRERLIYEDEDLESQIKTEFLEGGSDQLIELGEDDLLDGIESNQKAWSELKTGWGMTHKFSGMKFFLPLLYVAIFGTIHYFAYTTSRHGFEDENPYTMNHYKFNSNVC